MSVEVIPEFESLPESWDLRPLADLVSEDRKISYGIVQPGFHDDFGVPIIRVNNIRQNRIVADDVMRVSAEIESQYKRTRIQGGELLVTLVGSLGEVAIADDKYRGWNLARAVGVVPIADPAIAEWVKFYLGSRIARYFIGMWANTTVQHTLNLKDLAQLPVPLPPAGERQELIELIGSLDEKIELNRKQNRTLEAIAQALFKRWFVEFEFPDENGRPYKSSGGAMQPSELGEIPVGWEVKPLDQIAEYLNGLALQKFPPEGDEYLPVIKIREMRQGITESSDKASTRLDQKYIVDDGDVLFSWSGSLEVDIWCHGKGALNQHLFKVTSNDYPKWFYYLWTKHHLRAFQAIAADKATTMGHIQRGHLTDALTACPPDEELPRFSETFAPLIEKIISTRIEARTLTKLRDTLLPKLMSGELRVGDAA